MLTKIRQTILGLPRPLTIAIAGVSDYYWAYSTVGYVIGPSVGTLAGVVYGCYLVAAFAAAGCYGRTLVENASGKLRYLWPLTFTATLIWLITLRMVGVTVGTPGQLWGIVLLTGGDGDRATDGPPVRSPRSARLRRAPPP